MRETLLSFLDDYCLRGAKEVALAEHRGLRVVRWSYARLASVSYQFARELEARGIGKGERVIFWARNSPEWVAAFYGCLLRGAVVVPLDKESAPEFATRVQAQVGAKLLLHDAAQTFSFNNRLPALRLDELEQTVAERSDEPYAAEQVLADDLVEIIYTSGTTAEPRGVLLTHRNLLANITPLESEMQKYLKWEKLLVHPLRFLSLLPLSHVFGQFMSIFVPALLGSEVFFQESLNPSEVIAAARQQKANVIVTVPRLLETLRDKIERDYAAEKRAEDFRQALARADKWHPAKRWWAFRDVHRKFGWRLWAFISGGATLGEETEKFWRRSGFAVIQGYGMTETASLISVNHPFKMGRRSIGQTLPGQEIKLAVDGEILVRGANIARGYWNRGSEESLIDSEGWLHTGDLGEMDAQGNLYFKGRKKETIVTAAGLNIYPEDLEAALNAQSEVRESAVVSIESAHGPEPLAVLILRDEKADVEAVINRANQNLAQHQQIRRWAIWTERDFPRTKTQKIRKREITEILKRAGEAEEKSAAIENPAHAKNSLAASSSARGALASTSILSHIADGGALANLGSQARLASDLKLDSLGRVELLSALEDHYQLEIDEAAFTAATTVGDVEKIINEGAAESAAAHYPFAAWARRFPATWLRVLLFYVLVWPFVNLLGRPRFRGRENLRHLKGPLLFVSNHVTMTDHALIMAGLPLHLRHRLAIAMEGEILRDWVHTPAGTNLLTRLRYRLQYLLVVLIFNVFPLPQKSGFRRSFRFAGEQMDTGYSVLVFPEGKRTKDGRMNPFMQGTGLLVSQLGVPVMPAKLEGLFELKQQGRHFAWPGEVRVAFGEAVRFGAERDAASITRELEARVASL